MKLLAEKIIFNYQKKPNSKAHNGRNKCLSGKAGMANRSIIFSLLSVFLLAAFTYGTIFAMQTNEKKVFQATLKSNLKSTHEILYNWMYPKVHAAKFLATSHQLINWVDALQNTKNKSQNANDTQEAIRRFFDQKVTSAEYDGYYIIDDKGNNIATLNHDKIGEKNISWNAELSSSKTKYNKTQIQWPAFDGYTTDSDASKTKNVMHVIQPIISENGSRLATLIMEYNLDISFKDLFANGGGEKLVIIMYLTSMRYFYPKADLLMN